MEITLTIAVVIFLGAIICEFIDSSLGMLYGTILSPALIISGFEPLTVVPAILFSQAIGGMTASLIHHRLKNVDFSFKSTNPQHIMKRVSDLGFKEAFKRGTTKDIKVTIAVTLLGLIATILASLIAVNISKVFLKTYIGLLVLAMGIVLLSKASFKFSWGKMLGIGILSAFNKTVSGGGFGPVVTAGQVIGGRNGKNSIGVTTLSEAPICLAGFLTYYFAGKPENWNLILLLSAGALIGAVFGPFFTNKFKSEQKLKIVLGVLVLLLGIFVLANTWFFNIKGVSS